MVSSESGQPSASNRAVELEQELFQTALGFHQQGDLARADHVYARILQANPAYFEALRHRGMIARSSGALREAEAFFLRALQIRPDFAPLLSSYGLMLHDLGRFGEAIACYEKAIILAPGFSAAYYNIGITLEHLRRREAALACYDRAIAISADHADSHNNQGNTLKELHLFESALASYDRAIVLRPDDAATYNNRGVTLKELARFEDALSSYARAIAINPDYVAAYNNRGVAQQRMDRFTEALESFDAAVALHGQFAMAHYNRGAVLEALKEFELALGAYSRALVIKPDDPDALNNMGNTLRRLMRLGEALVCYENAVAINPERADVHSNRGVTLKEMKRYDEALSSFHTAIMLKPDSPGAFGNLGLSLKEMRRFDEAIACYDKAIIIDSDYSDAWNNRGVALQDLKRFDEAMDSFQMAIDCEADNLHAHSNLLFTMNYVESLAVETRVREARLFGARASAKAVRKFTAWQAPPEDGKFRIGFVSGDLRNHPVGYFLEGLLSQLDQTRFEVYAYSTIAMEDDLTQRLKSHVRVWRSLVDRSDEAAAKRIHTDGLHVLIDLAGHTAGNRLGVFAHRPAPVQASWLGYFATTGLAEVDYFVGDPHVAPNGEQHHFVERIIHLPQTYFCFTPPQRQVEVGPSPALANGYVTFGCFNNLAKLNARVVSVWAEVLKAVDGSRLFLKSGQLGDPGVIESTADMFGAAGVARERLLFEGPSDRTRYFEAFNRVDIALDPFPFPGGTTSVEGLWMGVPVVALKGSRFIAHNGETIAHNSGQSAWIANDEEDYIRKSAHFASDIAALAKLRVGLRAQVLGSALFDSVRFARHFETLMREMWEGYAGGASVQS